MRYPWANIALLILLVLQLTTGFLGLINGSENLRWILWLHGVAGYGIAAVLFWKGLIILDVFKRYKWRLNLPRLMFLVLTVLLLGILASGLIWTYAGPTYFLGFSLMTIHALLAIALAMLLAWHILVKWFVFRIPKARNRRAFLRMAGASLAGLALWRFAGPVKAALDLPGTTRRFTGSYETGSFTGHFPTVSWLLDFPPPVNIQDWRLIVEGAVERPLALTYKQLQQLASDRVTETLDCTGGWYSTQDWTGVNVGRLLDMAGVKEGAGSVTVEAVSGYGRRFSVEEARGYLLATHVAGKTLVHGHGFPVRLVAPGHRGFDWVKWVTRIRVNETGKFWQPPVPLQ
jgi:DMSO/TMAO reductase YedYZ molybdopterin-dependent catalytic subunit